MEPVKTSSAGAPGPRSGGSRRRRRRWGSRGRAPGARRCQAARVQRRTRRGSGGPGRRPAPRSAAACAIRLRAAPAAIRRSSSRQAAPDHVLDVVLEEHDGHRRPRGKVRGVRRGSRRRTGRTNPRPGGARARAAAPAPASARGRRAGARARSAARAAAKPALPCFGAREGEGRDPSAVRQLPSQLLGILPGAVAWSARSTSVAPGQLLQDLEAAQPPSGVEGPESADLDPQESHAGLSPGISAPSRDAKRGKPESGFGPP